MNTRGARIAAVVAGVLVLVGVVAYLAALGVLTGAVQPGPRASSALPTAAVSPPPSASPSPTPTGALGRYGYVFTTSAALGSVFTRDEPIVIRRERDATSVF